MKKNLNVNLFGRLYAIDEDAYDLLSNYVESLRSHFGKTEEGNEIVGDIEARIMELFEELKADGREAVCLEDVQSVINRIGNPGQMGEDYSSDKTDAGADATDEPSETVRRRFYCDTENKKVCGVLAGCASFFGGNVLSWRLGFIALLLTPIVLMKIYTVMFSFALDGAVYAHRTLSYDFTLPVSVVLLYVLVALIAPKTKTAADRLRMRGVAVNKETLAKELGEENEATAESQQNKGCADGCLSAIGMFFKVVGFIIIFAVVGSMLFMMIRALVISDGWNDLVFNLTSHYAHNPYAVTAAVCFMVLNAVLVYCAAHWLIAFFTKLKPMGKVVRYACWTVVAVAMVTTLFSLPLAAGWNRLYVEANMPSEEEQERYNESKYKASLNDGTWLNQEDSAYLAEGGWKLIKREECHNQGYTRTGEHYSGDKSVRYLDVFNDKGKMVYRAEHTEENVEEGTYTLAAAARAWGTGAFIYAIADGTVYMKEIPKTGNVGGGIWSFARERMRTIKERSVSENGVVRMSEQDIRLRKIAESNGGSGWGWNEVIIEGIKSTDGKISYGLTNDPELTGVKFSGQWFSACEFTLKKN